MTKEVDIDFDDLHSPKSQKQFDFIWSDADITVFGGAAGSGKAQPLTALVLTPDGFKPMGEIKVGSKVLTANKEVTTVTAIHPQPVKPIYKLTLKNKCSTESTIEHSWNVRLQKKKFIDFKTLSTKDLIEYLDKGYSVKVPQYNETFNCIVYSEVESLEYVRDDISQCITVQDEDHLYITDDYIVTHNSYNGVLRFLRYVNEPLYRGYVIRKTRMSMKNGIFADAIRLFTAWDKRIKVNRTDMTITFPSGAIIIFYGLDGQDAIDYFQGQEVSGALVDEATQIEYDEISWLMTRLRSNADVKPTVWFTCNPDPDHFIRAWVEPYLYPVKTYQKDDKGRMIDVGGRVDPEKNGKIRWYYVIGGQWYWGDDKEELTEKYKELLDEHQKPMSFRFIGATCLDNPVLMKKQPNYLSNLMNKSVIEVERLFRGNWFAREEAGGYWKHTWCRKLKTFPHVDDPNDVIEKRVRCWDLAYTEPNDANPDPDWSVGVLMFRTKNGYYGVEHVVRKRLRHGSLMAFITEVALKDYEMYGIIPQYIPEDPAAGKLTYAFTREYLMANGVTAVNKVTGSKQNNKLERFKNFAAASENGAVYIMEGEWNDLYFSELEAFDGTRNTRKDDQVDSTSDAFNVLYNKRKVRKNIVGNMF